MILTYDFLGNDFDYDIDYTDERRYFEQAYADEKERVDKFIENGYFDNLDDEFKAELGITKPEDLYNVEDIDWMIDEFIDNEYDFEDELLDYFAEEAFDMYETGNEYDEWSRDYERDQLK